MINSTVAPGQHEARGPPQALCKDLPPPQRWRDVADLRRLCLGREENPFPEDRYDDLEGEEAPIECWESYEVSNNTVKPLQESRGKCGRQNPDDCPRGSAFDRLSRGSAFERLGRVNDLREKLSRSRSAARSRREAVDG